MKDLKGLGVRSLILAGVAVSRIENVPGVPREWRIGWIVPSVLFAMACALMGRPRIGAAFNRVRREPLTALLLLDGLWMLSTGLRDRATALPAMHEVAHMVLPVAACIAVLAAIENDRTHRLVQLVAVACGFGVLAAGILGAVAALAGVDTGLAEVTNHALSGHWPRPTATLGWPDMFARSALVTAALSALPYSGGRILYRHVGLLVFVALACACASLSVIGLFAAGLLIAWVVPARVRRIGWLAAGGVLAVGIGRVYMHVHEVQLAGHVLRIAPEPGYEPLGYLVHPMHTVSLWGLTLSLHATGYAHIHHTAFSLLLANPCGIGGGRMPSVDYGPTLFTSGDWLSRGDAHSFYLRQAAEGGWIGAALVSAVAVRCLWLLYAARGFAPLSAAIGAALVCSAWFADPLRIDLAVFAALLAAHPAVTKGLRQSRRELGPERSDTGDGAPHVSQTMLVQPETMLRPTHQPLSATRKPFDATRKPFGAARKPC